MRAWFRANGVGTKLPRAIGSCGTVGLVADYGPAAGEPEAAGADARDRRGRVRFAGDDAPQGPSGRAESWGSQTSSRPASSNTAFAFFCQRAVAAYSTSTSTSGMTSVMPAI